MNQIHIIDTHAHYGSEAFDADRDAVLAAQWQSGVEAIVEQSTGPDDIGRVLNLAARYPRVFAAVGIHPEFAAAATEEAFERVFAAASQPKVVAVGEIGLDYHYENAAPREVQKRVFARQLAFAAQTGLPVSVHDRDVHADTMELLRRCRVRGVIHCFSGSVEMMQQAVAWGYYIGLGGVVTFRTAKKAAAVAAAVPADRLLLETDAPYMAPEPLRGTRCESRLLVYTARALAAIRGVPEAEIYRVTAENARRLFALP